MELIETLHDGRVYTYSFAVTSGSVSEEQEIAPAEDGRYKMILSPDIVYGVPPFISGIRTLSDVSAPSGGDSDTESADNSTPTPFPVSDAADISELTFNEQTISLSAQVNADGTVTYAYNDTSIKPAYVLDGETGYSIDITGRNDNGEIITTTQFQVTNHSQDNVILDNGMWLFDMSGLSGRDGKAGDAISATIEIGNNGLSITWSSVVLGDIPIDDLEQFYVTHNLNINGGLVFDEYVILGSEVLE